MRRVCQTPVSLLSRLKYTLSRTPWIAGAHLARRQRIDPAAILLNPAELGEGLWAASGRAGFGGADDNVRVGLIVLEVPVDDGRVVVRGAVASNCVGAARGVVRRRPSDLRQVLRPGAQDLGWRDADATTASDLVGRQGVRASSESWADDHEHAGHCHRGDAGRKHDCMACRLVRKVCV